MPVEDQIHSAVCALIAPGSRVQQVHRFRSTPLPFPAKLVVTTDEQSVVCVVKTATDPDRLRREAAVLGAMEDLDFAAPRVMAGPHIVPTSIGPIAVLVMSLVPGDALPWIGVSDVETADRTTRTLLDAVDQLHALTPRIAAHRVASDIPTWSLDDELAAAAERQSPWTETRILHRALDVLDRHIPRHRRSLVFSNGDYNPLNVLADDSGITGWVDFEFGGFEDPLIGFPKFLFWSEDSGWALGAKVGLVQRFLYRHRVPSAAFMVRVALRGLTHLHDTTPDEPPVPMLREIEQAITTLEFDE